MSIQQQIESSLSFLDNHYVHTFVTMFIGLYAALLAPRVSCSIKKIFNNTFFKIVFFFFVVFLAHKDAGLALIISLAFIFNLQFLHQDEIE